MAIKGQTMICKTLHRKLKIGQHIFYRFGYNSLEIKATNMFGHFAHNMSFDSHQRRPLYSTFIENKLSYTFCIHNQVILHQSKNTHRQRNDNIRHNMFSLNVFFPVRHSSDSYSLIL